MTWVGVSPFPLSATRESSTTYSKGGGEDWGDCSVSADLVLSSSDAGDRRVGVKGKRDAVNYSAGRSGGEPFAVS